MLTKTQLKELFAKHRFAPLKRFGENYLIDGNIKDKIIREADLSKADTVLEIGPGFGALTLDLASSAKTVIAVEKDKKAYELLKDLAGEDFTNLKLFNADILKFDLEKFAAYGKIKIIGNLPYYITSPIIEYLIEHRGSIESALILVQKEVAARLRAGPGTKDYGSLSCFVQFYTKPAYIYTVKRTSFYPSPDVDSALVRLDIPEKPAIEVRDERLLFKIIRGAFNQRRKSVINSLSREEVLDLPKEELSRVLSSAGVDPAARPEDLSLQDFARIADAIST